MVKRLSFMAIVVGLSAAAGIIAGAFIPGLSSLAPVIFGTAAGLSLFGDVLEKPLLWVRRDFKISNSFYNEYEIAGIRKSLSVFQTSAANLFVCSVLIKLVLAVCGGSLAYATTLSISDLVPYLKFIGFGTLGIAACVLGAQLRMILAYGKFCADYADETEMRERNDAALSALTSKAA